MKQLTILSLLLLASLSLILSADDPKSKRDVYASAYPYPGTNSYNPIQSGYNYLYVAPFICGTVPAGDTRYTPGEYVTSINIGAVLDTKLAIQLAINFPPSTQFEVGTTTATKFFSMIRRSSFTLDCSEILNPANFDRGTNGNFTYLSGYAYTDSREIIVMFDFISFRTNATTLDPDLEVLEIKATHVPSYSSHSGSYSSYSGSGQGGSYPYGSQQGGSYPYGGQGQGSSYPYSGQQGGSYPYGGQGQQYGGQGQYGQGQQYGGQGQYSGQGQQYGNYPYSGQQGGNYPYGGQGQQGGNYNPYGGQGQQYPYGQPK